jgi:hypothetical protein
MGSSVAFKCTYNNGGEGALVGFSGTCSDKNMELNVLQERRVWCSDRKCDCKKFIDGRMKERPRKPCQESKLFREWRFGAGGFCTGPKKGQPVPLRRAETGKFAILTTRFPGDHEKDRRIIGLFRIDVVEENAVRSEKKEGIRLTIEEARKLLFWRYYRNNAAREPDWRTGLFRYLKDGQVHNILADIAKIVKDAKTRKRVKALIGRAFGNQRTPRREGCLPRKVASAS